MSKIKTTSKVSLKLTSRINLWRRSACPRPALNFRHNPEAPRQLRKCHPQAEKDPQPPGTTKHGQRIATQWDTSKWQSQTMTKPKKQAKRHWSLPAGWNPEGEAHAPGQSLIPNTACKPPDSPERAIPGGKRLIAPPPRNYKTWIVDS